MNTQKRVSLGAVIAVLAIMILVSCGGGKTVSVAGTYTFTDDAYRFSEQLMIENWGEEEGKEWYAEVKEEYPNAKAVVEKDFDGNLSFELKPDGTFVYRIGDDVVEGTYTIGVQFVDENGRLRSEGVFDRDGRFLIIEEEIPLER